MKAPRHTSKTMTVLAAIADNSAKGISGAEIMAQCGLWSGTAYPILLRILEAGWVSAEWEMGDPSMLGRPLKRLYRICGLGQSELQAYRRSAEKDLRTIEAKWAT
ncbi:PadR family transcriptional regulator [Rhizobium leguminosarum bv. viciae]|nr:PadR family transcriptional regulator [Rhizobium leguminosarum bv. viciae]